MKKINNYSVQYKIISEQPNQNQNHSKMSANNMQSQQSCIPNGIKKKLSKQNQEFINYISASGFEQFFFLNNWIYQIL